ncbi:hypothetical protein GUJ93_ZPchr0009g1184 [Zizania palustris]|uniref:Uncharacterized protein n=1 Tax=Zizania palustris TaxID=103762 RepID=A0A8J5RSK7_ZIZPA|nr:hypothetical protein GUJ93_ZPchr0009g1184 [Zizania palustris]
MAGTVGTVVFISERISRLTSTQKSKGHRSDVPEIQLLDPSREFCEALAGAISSATFERRQGEDQLGLGMTGRQSNGDGAHGDGGGACEWGRERRGGLAQGGEPRNRWDG